MSNIRVGAQMYTCHQHLKTAEDVKTSFEKISAMGYTCAQVSGIPAGTIETPALAQLLKDTGIECSVTHVPLDMMKDTNKCVEYHQALGCKYTAIGGFFPQENQYDPKLWIDFAKEYNDIVAKLAEHGLTAGYHNHSHEWIHCTNGKTPIELIHENSNSNVWFEIDVYWVAHGGGDPCQWLEKVANRCPVLHYKDMGIDHERNQFMCEVGDGNLNWERIIETTKKIGTEYVMVERDSGKLDPFDSLEVSLKNLKAMGLNP
ncbi:MAG TPA: hypothetical protein DER01_18270 [Phycisphaerales bacterium]|nr:hypothetical protein [Phycisphaerales bacterium]|tara:strand:+ start:27176 stop:27955 length:780 start_codon:yes stop_codon:yes gene_type:complete